MKYVGLQTQIWKNNTRSTLLLIAFPMLILSLTWLFFFIQDKLDPETIIDPNSMLIQYSPVVLFCVGIWFLIAYSSHTSIIKKATGSSPLERKDNKKIYNMVENLCISVGMTMPKINIINDSSLNAFASGINEKSYTVTLSKGLIDKLDDDELEGVIAHELTHIRNKDVRLLIISIVFVGIFAFASEFLFHSLRHSKRDKDGGKQLIIVAMVLAFVGYFAALLFKFALSRKREFLADAGAAEMTKKPKALANALRKVSKDPLIEVVDNKDVAQMFIENPQLKKSSIFSMFATHPPIEKRIQVLEQF